MLMQLQKSSDQTNQVMHMVIVTEQATVTAFIGFVVTVMANHILHKTGNKG